jgi:hypothetical protein
MWDPLQVKVTVPLKEVDPEAVWQLWVSLAPETRIPAGPENWIVVPELVVSVTT